MSTSYSLIVRYLPEVVPFFRKAGILSEIGWSIPDYVELLWSKKDRTTSCESDNISPDSNSSQISTDSKTIPLFGAFIRRLHLTQVTKRSAHFSPDDSDTFTTENSSSDGSTSTYEVFVIQSPDLSKYCIFRFDNDIQRSSWFRAIQNAIGNLNSTIIDSINRTDKYRSYFDSKLVYMGWFCQSKKLSLLQSLFSEVIIVSIKTFDYN